MTRTSRAASNSHKAMTCGTRVRCAEATGDVPLGHDERFDIGGTQPAAAQGRVVP
jgi:hypothetical protein